jgi:predicted enzyme related to lactoylglutathione lyase
MVSIQNITFDAADPRALADFWAAVLERPVAPGANEFVAIIGGPELENGQPNFLFIKVPEGKSAKNRMHIDFDCADLDAERKRLEGLGASFVHEKDEWGVHWLTFLDPEGNEFCVAKH